MNMKNLNRRELGMALSAFAMMSSLSAEGQTGQARGRAQDRSY